MTQAIFLSYASQDAEAARRLCDSLRAAGLEVWFDQSELRGGDAWDASIRKQIKECALFVPIISANTQAREEGYFRLEWKLAVDRSHLMAEHKAFFMPVVLGDVREPDAHVPDKFRERQWTPVSSDESIAAFAERVAKVLVGSGVSAQSVPRAAPVSESERVSGAHVPKKTPTGLAASPSAAPSSEIAPPPAMPLPHPEKSSRARLLVGALVVAVLAALSGGWVVLDRNRKAAFVAESINKIESLSRSTKYFEAFQLARQVERAGGDTSLSEAIQNSYSRAINIQSTPAGASISIRPFGETSKDAAWIELGTTPMEKLRVPRGAMEWRATLAGHATEYQTGFAATNKQVSIALWPPGASEAAMVPVRGGAFEWGALPGLGLAEKVSLAPYLIDREELTNRDYAKFVQAGGYAREEYWKVPFAEHGKTLGFADAIARFKDATGRTGPATWKLGQYPEGEADLPVRGISWYESAAYAVFAGKQLPTLYHWYFADNEGDRYAMPGVLLPVANFENKALRKAADTKAASAFGAVNMAGNVSEWVANWTDRGRALAVGGSLLDAAYQYAEPTPRSAFDRAADVGVRLMKRNNPAGDAGADPASARIMEKPRLTAKQIKPVSDAEYAIYARQFELRAIPLEVKAESVEDTSAVWIRHKVSYAAGYGGERMNAFLYLPRNSRPPFQTIIFMTGSNAFGNFRAFEREADFPGWSHADMLLRGGRAVLVPIWKGSFERSEKEEPTPAALRTNQQQWVSDLNQSMAFLDTRREVDPARIGYYGVSKGATQGVLLLALELRLKLGVLVVGGLNFARSNGDLLPPESSNATYAPRVKVPVLMVNGRDDAMFPYETSQLPLFNLLGSPPEKKKHKTYPGGHFVFGWYDELARDTHDWFDEQFGPVRPAVSAASK